MWLTFGRHTANPALATLLATLFKKTPLFPLFREASG